ncbi:MAG TPA: cytochrome c biogenesis protein CcsA [Thermoanaerobaculia bacterium]|nr:cytochrome c biogenesis protein CcsA [Thermoanaerobaculia bacterium]
MPALYIASLFYLLGTLAVLLSLMLRSRRLQHIALVSMVAGFVAHTVWIGVICTRTGHPPLTNLPETAAFIGWTILLVELFLFIRYRVHAAAFFVYPLVLMLLSISLVVGEPFAHLDEAQRSNLFTSHLLLTTVGIAGLLIGLAFMILAQIQERALKMKHRGRLYDWIPSLRVCELVSYRALSIGFAIYTIGLLAGVLWAYRTSPGVFSLRAKEIGALVAWVLFAVLVQAHVSGTYRTQKNAVVGAAAFVSILVAIFGIQHG